METDWLATLCRTVKNGLPDLAWEWDYGLGAALCAFGMDQAVEVREVLASSFADSWTSESIAKAPAPVVEIANACRGIRPGQMLITSNSSQPVLAYAAWWPWGSGDRVSVRISLATAADGGPPAELVAVLRESFGL